MNKFISNLKKCSRKKWLGIDKLEVSVFFFIDSNEEEDIKRVNDNIKFFLLDEDNDIYVIDLADKENDVNIFKGNVCYLRAEGGFQPEKLSSLISNKNIVVGVSSNISLKEGFLEYIDANIFDNKLILRGDGDDSILFIESRDALSVINFCMNPVSPKFKEEEIPMDMFFVHHFNFKNKSLSDFKVFDKNGMEIDLYNNRVINGMWVGDSLTNVEKLSINSFLKNGHDYHLYLYDDIEGIPDGVVVKDANEILDGSKIFKYKKMGRRRGSDVGNEGFAGFADWFRAALLYKHGGWWADLDSICLKKFDILRPYVFTTLRHYWHNLYNGVIKAQRNSLVMSYCNSCCEEKGEHARWCYTGPKLLYSAYNMYGLQDFSFNREVIEPMTREESKDIFKDHMKINIEDAYAVHLFNYRLLSEGVDKDGVFPKNSLFEKLKRKYL